MIDQTLPLTVENIPFKKKVFSGIGFELDEGIDIRGVVKSPDSKVIKNNSFVIDQKEKLPESGCLFF